MKSLKKKFFEVVVGPTCGCNLTRPLGGSIKDHLLGLLEVLNVLGIGDAIDIPKLQHQNANHKSCMVSA